MQELIQQSTNKTFVEEWCFFKRNEFVESPQPQFSTIPESLPVLTMSSCPSVKRRSTRHVRRRPRAVCRCGPLSTRIHQTLSYHVMIPLALSFLLLRAPLRFNFSFFLSSLHWSLRLSRLSFSLLLSSHFLLSRFLSFLFLSRLLRSPLLSRLLRSPLLLQRLLRSPLFFSRLRSPLFLRLLRSPLLSRLLRFFLFLRLLHSPSLSFTRHLLLPCLFLSFPFFVLATIFLTSCWLTSSSSSSFVNFVL